MPRQPHGRDDHIDTPPDCDHFLDGGDIDLRLKLDVVAPGESYIATEYGLGYQLTGPSQPTGDG